MPFKKVFYALIINFLVTDFANAQASQDKAEITKTEPVKSEVANQNPYVINNIFAFAKEKDSADSRIKATAQANRSAFAKLLENLNISDFKKNLTDTEIEDLIYSKQINDEKIAGNYYSAKFNISFLKSAVNSALNISSNTPTPAPENLAKEIFLLFPVQIIDDKPVLWEKTNIWRKDIENFVLANNVKSILVPDAQDIDLSDIDLKNLKEDDFAHFTSVIYRHAAKGVIIAYYEVDTIENKANITLKTIEFPDVKKIKLSFINSDHLDEGGLLQESAQRTMNYILQNNKKPEIKIKYNEDEEINLNVEITDLENWMEIEDRIRDMHFVRDLKLQSISKNIAKVTLTSSEANNFSKLFAQYNFSLKRENGEYFLSPAKPVN